MGLLKFIAAGAAVGYGIHYITKKGPDGRSVMDNVAENAPQWFDRAKKYTEYTVEQLKQSIQPKNS